jgi:hypothetical protein
MFKFPNFVHLKEPASGSFAVLEELVLEFCSRIDSINLNCLSEFKNLKRLMLYCGIRSGSRNYPLTFDSLNSGSFSELVFLEELIIRKCISQIPENLFSNLTNLESLNLYHNNFS